jgi:hypothetical protein
MAAELRRCDDTPQRAALQSLVHAIHGRPAPAGRGTLARSQGPASLAFHRGRVTAAVPRDGSNTGSALRFMTLVVRSSHMRSSSAKARSRSPT